MYSWCKYFNLGRTLRTSPRSQQQRYEDQRTCVNCPLLQLFGGLNPSEKYYIVNWDDYFQYMEKYQMFQTTSSGLVSTSSVVTHHVEKKWQKQMANWSKPWHPAVHITTSDMCGCPAPQVYGKSMKIIGFDPFPKGRMI